MDIHDVTASLPGIAAVAMLLGVRHGLDADHLAAIDGLTRFSSPLQPRLARLAGTLFSLGHGAVVVSVAVGASLLAPHVAVPLWFATLGAWLSISVLLALGLINLTALLRRQRGHAAHPHGWRSWLLAPLLKAHSPAATLGVGMLFALSFDTLSQAALFSMVAVRFGGWPTALLLALAFVAGMLLMDGLNGLWIARLIRQSALTALVANRTMTLAVAGISLLTAGLGVATQILPKGAAAWATHGGWLSLLIMGVVLLSFLGGRWMAQRELQPAPARRALHINSGDPAV